MKWIKLAGVVFCLLFAVSASAEFYKYRDKDGNVHFTDDFNKVPPEQRAAVKGYEEIITAPEEEKEPADSQSQAAAATDASKAADQKAKYDLNSKIKDLDKRKVELANEYDSLMKENETIAKMRKEVKTPADALKYNETVKALNKRLKEHDKKRKAFYADVEEYNARVAELNQAKEKSKPQEVSD